MRPGRALHAAGCLLTDPLRGARGRHRSTAQMRAILHPLARRAGARGAPPAVWIGLVEHLGDLVAAQPLVDVVRARHPGHRVLWAVRAPYRALVERFTGVDEVVVVHCLTEWIYLARGSRGAPVYDLHLSGRFCDVCDLRHERPNARVDADSYYQRGGLQQAFADAAGLPFPDADPTLVVPDGVRARVDRLCLPDGAVVIHARSNQNPRDWHDDGWEALVQALSARGVPTVEVGLEAAVGGGAPRHHDLCGRLSLLEMAEVIRRAARFVGIDSGPAHLAQAVGTPSVVLLGRYRHFSRYLPYAGRWSRGEGLVVLRSDGPARDLPVTKVIDAVTPGLPSQPAPRVSVVIPTHAHRALLGATLQSVFQQTFADREVIVVDDGSTDGTFELLQPLAESGRIRLLRQANAGTAAARNAGLTAARGELVAFLDDDDLWPADKLAWQVDVLDADPSAVLVWGDHVYLGAEDRPADARTGAPPQGDVQRAFRLRNWIHSLGQSLIRTTALRRAGGFDPDVWGSDDWDMLLRLAREGAFRHRPRVALRYRRHGDNASRRALDHARDHLRVMHRHVGWNLPLTVRHLRAAAAYFVPNLIRFVADAPLPRQRLAGCCHAVLFQPSLLLRPWFVRAMFGAAAASARPRLRDHGSGG